MQTGKHLKIKKFGDAVHGVILEGNPQKPERMFCIPLENAKYPELYPSVFEKYERDPDNMFFWKNGILK